MVFIDTRDQATAVTQRSDLGGDIRALIGTKQGQNKF